MPISLINFKKVDPLNDLEAISLHAESDFLKFCKKSENEDYLFVVHEYHPENDDKIIANELYVFDVTSKHWFKYREL